MNLFLFTSKLLLLLRIFYHSNAFVAVAQQQQRSFGSALHSSSSRFSKRNPLDWESSQERQSRMELVREIQKTFYAEEILRMHSQYGLFENMPLWRDDRVELPGFQHVINATDAEWSHFIYQIVSGPKPWYYGHVYLPGGADNRANPNFRLEPMSQAPMTGTLMQISDYHTTSEDGSLQVVVQALGRVLVSDVLRHAPPYPIATVELLPDEELVQAKYREAQLLLSTHDFALNDNARGAACAGAVEEAAQWRDYEFPQESSLADGSSSTSSLSPVSNFNETTNASTSAVSQNAATTAMEEYLSQPPIDMHQGECSLGDDNDGDDNDESTSLLESALHLEREVWMELDKLARMAERVFPERYKTIWPIPPQVLGLLPAPPIRPWPRFFQLAKFAYRMSRLSKLSGNRKIRFSQAQKGYPAHRRIRRFSYVVWVLLDSFDYQDDSISKQDILEMDSTTERLLAAKKRVQRINKELLYTIEREL